MKEWVAVLILTRERGFKLSSHASGVLGDNHSNGSSRRRNTKKSYEIKAITDSAYAMGVK
jgi:hypothetical protein